MEQEPLVWELVLLAWVQEPLVWELVLLVLEPRPEQGQGQGWKHMSEAYLLDLDMDNHSAVLKVQLDK